MSTEPEPRTAEEYFERGKRLWQSGHRGCAISDYEHAVTLDPQSPAAVALKMARQIMDFYHTDLYNP